MEITQTILIFDAIALVGIMVTDISIIRKINFTKSPTPCVSHYAYAVKASVLGGFFNSVFIRAE